MVHEPIREVRPITVVRLVKPLNKVDQVGLARKEGSSLSIHSNPKKKGTTIADP